MLWSCGWPPGVAPQDRQGAGGGARGCSRNLWNCGRLLGGVPQDRQGPAALGCPRSCGVAAGGVRPFLRALRIGVMATGWRRGPLPRVAYLDRPGLAQGATRAVSLRVILGDLP